MLHQEQSSQPALFGIVWTVAQHSESDAGCHVHADVVRHVIQRHSDCDDGDVHVSRGQVAELQAVGSGVSLSAVCRESVCQDMSLAVLSDDPKVSVFKCHIGAILREK